MLDGPALRLQMHIQITLCRLFPQSVEGAHLAACIDDLSIADVHEVEVALTNALIVQLAAHVLFLFNDLRMDWMLEAASACKSRLQVATANI